MSISTLNSDNIDSIFEDSTINSKFNVNGIPNETSIFILFYLVYLIKILI